MDWVNTIFGHGTDLNFMQMSCRAILIFFITLLLLRIAGLRTFGKKSAFDNVIIIMLGSVMSRAVVGASPFWATVGACFMFVIVHWLLGKLSYHSDAIGSLIKGEGLSLYADGEENRHNMQKTKISHKDLEEEIRISINSNTLEQVKEIFIERNGEISVIKKR